MSQRNARRRCAWAGVLLLAGLFVGCHGDTDQGGGQEKGSAGTSPVRQRPQQPIPQTPTADQVDPSSPKAVLGGTSTTQPSAKPATAQQGPPR